MTKYFSLQNDKVPWTSILTSMPVQALNICNFARSWVFFLLLTNEPTYLNTFGFTLAEVRAKKKQTKKHRCPPTQSHIELVQGSSSLSITSTSPMRIWSEVRTLAGQHFTIWTAHQFTLSCVKLCRIKSAARLFGDLGGAHAKSAQLRRDCPHPGILKSWVAVIPNWG